MTNFYSENQGENGFSPLKKAEEMYQCQHCRSYFTPRKRFVQKYCSESCRVMASRQRKSGINNFQGINSGTKNSSNKNKAKDSKQNELKEELLEDLLPQLKDVISKRDKVFEKKLNEINKKLNLAIGLSAYDAVATDSMKENLKDNFHNILQNFLQNISNTTNNSELQQKSKKTKSGLPPLSRSKEHKADNTKEGNSGEQK